MNALKIETGHPVTLDVKPVDGDTVRFVTPDGRCMFEVRARNDGKSIEVRGVDTTRINGVLLGEALLIQPQAANSVIITTREW